MGVPKFYKRFIEQIPNFETNVSNCFSLSMDLNGFIHACCRQIYGYGKTVDNQDIPIDKINKIKELLRTGDPTNRLINELILLIKSSLSNLVLDKIKPSTVLIITLDGKAPFAKCNQQRGRRFKSGYERYMKATTEFINYDELFDTSFLTAGTDFMNLVSSTVKEWIQENKTLLPYYTVFSGSDIEGEGEHKIYKILEELKTNIINNETVETEKDKSKTFNDQKHIIYGLDADLCFLSMLREYNFIWLRENFNIFNVEDCTNIKVVKKYIIEIQLNEMLLLGKN